MSNSLSDVFKYIQPRC